MKMKKKYSSGEATQYLTRKAALRKLQISLNHFRMLCIFKGIYPREPHNRKKAQRGRSGVKILYNKKDIQFLLHEPLIWVLRAMNVYYRRIDKARALKNFEKLQQLRANAPTLRLDHIVKERYPTFIDTLHDLDDCVTLLCLFSTFPAMKNVQSEHIQMSRRLTTEFMLAIIEARALRKVFISIKGFYFQAELRGQKITWIVPHNFPFKEQSKKEVDFKTITLFAQFYIYLLGFVNCHLYHSLNLTYPPKLVSTKSNVNTKLYVTAKELNYERCASLSVQIKRTGTVNVLEKQEEIPEIDNFDEFLTESESTKIKIENEKTEKLKSLFKGLRFFLNREVPRDVLVFIIRAFGGLVSWDVNVCIGATYREDDESITHQVVDRPSVGKQYLSRYYVQPQWLFDSVNARQLLPVSKYYMGVQLPPHLSPFSSDNDYKYVPSEENVMNDNEKIEMFNENDNEVDEMDVSDKEINDMDVSDIEINDNKDNDEEEEEEDSGCEIESLKVTAGKVHRENPNAAKIRERYDIKLREKMIRRKHKNLYRKLMNSRRRKDKEVNLLKKKRQILDAEGSIITKKIKLI